jgi:hypothetical protein
MYVSQCNTESRSNLGVGTLAMRFYVLQNFIHGKGNPQLFLIVPVLLATHSDTQARMGNKRWQQGRNTNIALAQAQRLEHTLEQAVHTPGTAENTLGTDMDTGRPDHRL